MIQTKFDGITLPVYIISLPERKDRRKSIQEEFSDKPEFDVHLTDAVKHRIGAVGLWKSITNIIKSVASRDDDDVIVLCEDDHHFTSNYDRDLFFSQIVEGASYGAELLYGGVCRFGNLVPVKEGLFWLDWSWCTQFVVVYRPAFHRIIEAAFSDTDVADEFLSHMFSKKFLVEPFVSVQKDFGYSDIEKGYNGDDFTQQFDLAEKQMRNYTRVARKYNLFHRGIE